MSVREASLQQQDPVLASGLTRLFGAGAAVGAVVVAVCMTLLEADQVASGAVEVLAIAVLATAGALFVRLASPFRAPFRRRSFVIVLAVVLLAFVLDEIAQLGANHITHDDWGLVVVAVYLFAFATVRPARDVLVGGLIAAGVVALVIAAVAPFVAVHAAVLPRVMVALVSVMPPALAAAAFAGRALRSLQRSAAVAETAASASAPSEAVRLSAQQERIAQLEAEVVPLMKRLIADDVLTAADGARARAIATGLRAALVAELARDWLAELGFAVTDARSYAALMSTEQRTTVAAMVRALPLADPARPGRATIVGQDYDAVLELTLPLAQRPDRALLAPAMLLMRTVFSSVRTRTEALTVTITADVAVPRRRT